MNLSALTSGSRPRKTASPELPDALPRSPGNGKAPKLPFRSERFNERAPPRWLVGAEAEDAGSDADSVVSDYRDDSEQLDATTTMGSSSRAASSTDSAAAEVKKARSTHKKETKDLELPAVAGAESRQRPASVSSGLESLSPQSSGSPSRSAEKVAVTKTDSSDVPVSASTAGEWVNRLQALKEVAEEHYSCAGRVYGHVVDMFPEARTFSSALKTTIVEEIFAELELSRDILERHAQGLIGTDLAELRMIKAESKRLDDKLARMKKLFAKEVTNLRDLFLKKEAGCEFKLKDSYEPLMFMEPDQRGWTLELLEGKLEALFESSPETARSVNKTELARLQDLFRKEKISALERQVAKLTEEDKAAKQQIDVLEAFNEKLANRLLKEDGGSSTPSKDRGTPEASRPAREGGAVIALPAGKPKSGRPKRGATFTRAASGEQAADEATEAQPG